jgi:D-alanyl-D-alanine carboxypeptidase
MIMFQRVRPISPKLIILFAILLLIGLIEMVVILWQLDKEELKKPIPSSKDTVQATQNDFDKTRYAIHEATSLWVIVNKGRILPDSYVPQNLEVPAVPLRFSAAAEEMKLRNEAARALGTLFVAAAHDKIYLRLASGYRSYSTQEIIYNREVRNFGQSQADRQSARPGHSEHQTGLAADLEPADRRCEIDVCFADTAEGKWLLANAYRYGFILRYPENKEPQTGYQYEPWHYRFVGVDLAYQIQQSGLSLEEFFAQPFYTSYPREIYELG